MKRGAFTGANNAGKSGKFEIADRGVLFLDEISSMPLAMQSKLLRVIQEKEVERLGGTKRKKIDVKIVAATNINIEELVKQNRFREDLFYRLNVINIRVPPLRERPEDILLLASHFLQIYQSRFYKPLTKLSYGASKLLESYRWPGNVRELKNVMERLAIMCDGRHITQLDITNYTSIQQHEKVPNTLKEQIDYYEKTIIIDSLKRHNGNKSLVALELGLNRTTLYSKLHKYSILCQESAKPE